MMKTIFNLLLLMCPMICQAQWSPSQLFGNDFKVLAVPGDSNVYVCGPSKHIYYSHNGGTKWNVFTTEYEHEFMMDIDFVNDSVGYICGGGWFSPHRNIIMRTTNAGLSWQTISKDSMGTYQFLFSKIDFVNKDSGLVLSQYGSELFRTYNGGSTWEALLLDTFQNMNVSDMQFVDASLGFICTDGQTTAAQKSKIYRTTDFGNSWQVVKELDFNKSLLKIHFIDKHHGFVSGSDGKIYKTNDGGATWTESTIAPGNAIDALWFTDTLNGYCNALGVIGKSTDGGNTFHAQQMGINNIVTDIQFSPSAKTGFLIAGNIVYKTTNGGLSIKKLSELSDAVTIYPNPAQQIVYIDYPRQWQIESINLLDISGKVVRQFAVGQKQFDITQISNGTYHLMIKTKEGAISKPLVVQ